jgi:hypothetical protein
MLGVRGYYKVCSIAFYKVADCARYVLSVVCCWAIVIQREYGRIKEA